MESEESRMRLFDWLLRMFNPLRWGIKHGMHVGKGVTLSSKNGTTFGSEPYLIWLDDYVRLSGGVSFITHDGGTYAIRDQEIYRDVAAFGSIHIGERTFIGYRAIIMPGVRIGKHCIIGAGALVAEDIPDNSVAVGIPAKVITTIDKYAGKINMKSKDLYDITRLKQDKKAYLESLAIEGKI